MSHKRYAFSLLSQSVLISILFIHKGQYPRGLGDDLQGGLDGDMQGGLGDEQQGIY